MLTYLADNNLNGANDPVQVYLTCYKLLTALDNPEAKTWLHQGQNWLEQRRAALTNQNLRDSFLNRIPSHREVCVQALEIGG
jgi:hypothetical protein